MPDMRKKIEQFIHNCISCIIAEKAQGKQEGLLNSIQKGSLTFDTYHVDYMGPLPATQKRYQYLLAVIDAFAKFVWLYSTRTTNSTELIEHLQKQAAIFDNLRRIISDRRSAFTSSEFGEYCKQKNIHKHLITILFPESMAKLKG